MLEFMKEHFNTIWPIMAILIAWLLPAPRFKKLGKQVGEQLPPKLAEMLSERLRAFERGLMLAHVKGDTNLVDNKTIKNEMKKVKLDLGLEE